MSEPRQEDDIDATNEPRRKRKTFLIIGGVFFIVALIAITLILLSLYSNVLHENQYIKPLTELFQNQKENTDSQSQLPIENTIMIPKIHVDARIFEGEDESVLEEGIWHYPDTAIPKEEGAMVLTGHRFQYGPGSSKSLYSMNEIENGDEIKIFWEGKEFTYIVDTIYEVNDEQLDILEKGNKEKLLIFTCTPLFQHDKRLVVEARRVEK